MAEIRLAETAGFCFGVRRAVEKVYEEAGKAAGPVYTYGPVIHNEEVVRDLEKKGVRVLHSEEELKDLEEGTVIIRSHGVGKKIYDICAGKDKVRLVDATCPDVIRTHTIVREHAAHGDVIYIGKKNHPESEGTVGLSSRVHLVTSAADVEKLDGLENILITNQTTLSLIDTQEIIDACLARWPDAVVCKEICNATRVRQEAVMNLKDTDVLIVVGDPRSNNSNQLREIGTKAGIPETCLIESVLSLKEEMVKNKNRIAVTSGSSTPNSLTTQIITFLQEYARTGQFILPEEVISTLL